MRVSTDGCSELTCIYHGEENRRKIEAGEYDQQCVFCGMEREPHEFEDGLRCIYCVEEGEGGRGM